MGLAFAFGWTPCIGPILAAILAVASAEQTVASGAALLGAYALGLGAPFILARSRWVRFFMSRGAFAASSGGWKRASARCWC